MHYKKAITTGDTDDMITALGGMVQTSGGAVLAIGGANTVDYALLSKVVGVGNTLTGTEGNESKLNMIDALPTPVPMSIMLRSSVVVIRLLISQQFHCSWG